MNAQFLAVVREQKCIPQSGKREFNKNLKVLFKQASTTGLSIEAQEAVIDVALDLELDGSTFKNLILCLIPKEKVPKDIVDRVFPWLLIHYHDNAYEEKISWLLDWIACLLDHKLIDKEAVDQYYNLLFVALDKNWTNVSYILYLLTKPEDVTKWRINVIEGSKTRFLEPAHLCALLKRFKELNPNFMYHTVQVRQTIEKIFCDKNKFYQQVKGSLSRRNIPLSSSSMSVIPLTDHKKFIEDSQDMILPPIQYLQPNRSPQKFGEYHVDDITKGEDLVKNFHKLALPLNTLSLLNSSTGINVLMLSNRPVQEHFFENLHRILEENLVCKRSNYSINEVENLLENVLRLQQIFNQGFTSVSRVFSVFLQSWDGHQYRLQVFKILEWFVFKVHAELNRFLLLPLHTLCITGEPEEQCDVILCLSNLIRNMYTRLNRAVSNYKNIFEEPNILNSPEDLLQIIKSLTKFTCEICRLTLYIYPCNNQILLVSLMFYEKILELEIQYNVPWWTIISSNVVYQCLFSANIDLLNQMCNLWLRYRKVAQSLYYNKAIKVEDKEERLGQFAGDMFNILWTGQAFSHRLHGYIFTGLSATDEFNWRKYVNLNNSLTLERHMMFSPYRMLLAGKFHKSWNSLSKEDVLLLLRDRFTDLHDVIHKMVLSMGIVDEEELD